ncbi:MAG: sugar ABC transporter ATP-binding protein, partial [Planctomycetales bacterium]
LFQAMRALKQSGVGVIYISHFLEEIREVCDHFTVIRDGELAGSGRVEDVEYSEIVSLMAGRSVDQLFPTTPHEPGEVILSVESLCGNPFPKDVSLTLRRGEILGIAGLVGAGRTELLRCLMALDPVRSGRVVIDGTVPRGNPRARSRAGFGMVAEDRKAEGLAQNQSVAENLTLSRLQPYRCWGWLNLARRRQAVAEWMKTLRIKARSPDQPVNELSGGNQQKTALARVLHQDADVLLLDEPTRGVDVATKAEIYRLIGEQAARGKAILFVSSYLPELLAVCDRVGVMARGGLREVRPANEWTEESALACAIGSEEE